MHGRLVKGAALQTLMSTAVSVCTICTYAIIGRWYGSDALGQVAFWTAASRIYLTALDFGASPTVRRDLAAAGAIGKRRRYEAAFQMRLLSMASGLFVVGSFWALTGRPLSELATCLAVYIYVGTRSLLDLSTVVYVARGTFGVPAFIVVANEVATFLAVAAAAVYRRELSSGLWMCCLICTLAGFICLRATWRQYGYRVRWRLDWRGIKEVVKRGFATGSYVLCGMVLQKFDSTLLGIVSEKAAVALYNAASNIAVGTRLLPAAVGQAALPAVTRAFTTGDRTGIKIVAELYCAMVAAGVVVGAAVFILARLLVSTVFGAGFEPAASCLGILAFAIPFSYFNSISWSVCVATYRDRVPVYAIVIGTCTSVAANLAMVPALGQNGAAYASCAAEAVMTVTYLLLFTRGGWGMFLRGGSGPEAVNGMARVAAAAAAPRMKG